MTPSEQLSSARAWIVCGVIGVAALLVGVAVGWGLAPRQWASQAKGGSVRQAETGPAVASVFSSAKTRAADKRAAELATALLDQLNANPAMLVPALVAIGNPGERMDAMIELIGRLGVDQFPQLFTGLLAGMGALEDATVGDSLYDNEDFMIMAFMGLDRWSSLRPGAPTAFAMGLADGDDGKMRQVREMMAAVGTAFAFRYDPDYTLEKAMADLAPLLDDGEDPDEGDLGGVASFQVAGTAMRSLTEGLRLLRADGTGSSDLDASEIFDLLDVRGESPAAVMAELMQFKGEARQDAVESYMEVLGASDPARALTVIDGIEDQALAQKALEGLVEGWGSVDPAAALGVVNRFRDEEAKRKVTTELLKEWGEHDPAAAVEWAVEVLTLWPFEGPRALTEEIWLELAEDVSRVDGTATVRLLEALSPESLRSFAESNPNTISNFARFDPETAFAWFNGRPESVGGKVFRTLGGALAEHDPVLALERLGDITAGDERTEFVTGLAGVFASRDPDGFGAWVGTLSGDLRASAISHGIGDWARADPAAAAAFSLREGVDAGLRTSLQAWAQSDPFGAYAWTAQSAPDRAADLLTSAGLLTQMTNADPQAASEAVLALSPEIRTQHLVGVVHTWSEVDPAAASAFLAEANVAGEAGDLAAAALARNLYSDDPDSARHWVASIENDAMREELIRAIAPGETGDE